MQDFSRRARDTETACITLTIFKPSSPCRIVEEKGGGIVVRRIDDERSRLRERVQDGAESPRFPAANVVLMSQFPSAALQFEGIGANTEDSSRKQTMEEKVCFTYSGMFLSGYCRG
jgi:hypothetical protein